MVLEITSIYIKGNTKCYGCLLVFTISIVDIKYILQKAVRLNERTLYYYKVSDINIFY